MMKFHNVLLACALGAGSLLAATAPASAAHVVVGTVRPATAARVSHGYHYYRSYGYRYGYRYPYRYGYGYPYRYGYGYPYRYGYGISVGVGYGGYIGGGYGYAPQPAVYGYGPRAYWVRRPFWRPYRRVFWRGRFVR